MPNQQNYIPIPESLRGQLEENGTLEIDYTLVNEGGVDYLKVSAVEGNPVGDVTEPATPEETLKKKIGFKGPEVSEEPEMI